MRVITRNIWDRVEFFLCVIKFSTLCDLREFCIHQHTFASKFDKCAVINRPPTESNQAHEDQSDESKPGFRWVATSKLLELIVLVALHIFVVLLQDGLTNVVGRSISRHFR